jgi:hypothetical protein
MKLEKWIEKKTEELKTVKKYREVKFDRADPCEIGRNFNGYILSFCGSKRIETSTEIDENFDRKSLPDTYSEEGKVKGVMVTFEVLKPRKRKKESEYFYLKIA